jgi:hypothetical protein
VKRTLAGFALLLLALIVIEAVVLEWAWPALETWRMTPRVRFEPIGALRPGAYAERDMWLARPDLDVDDAHFLPPGVSHGRRSDAWVFVLHATTYMARNHWNAPLDHVDSQMRARLAMRSQASVFNDAAAVYAPRYRQAALGTFMVDRPESQAALALAERDARAALALFLHDAPPGAPVVLAGQGQGALILMRLLRGTPLAHRIVAVYLSGWPVSVHHDLPAIGLPACTGPDQTGCVMAWTTFAAPPDPRLFQAMVHRYPALDGTPGGTTDMLCTNPLNGGHAAEASAQANLGSLATGDEVRSSALVRPSVGARCDPHTGLLLIPQPPHLGDQIGSGGDYSAYDFALFWGNLRADVARREALWQGAQTHQEHPAS